MSTVFIVKVYDCGETSIDGVYSKEVDAIERARELAEYSGLKEEEDNPYYYEDEYQQNAIEVSEWDVL
jgi:hypothetical protein